MDSAKSRRSSSLAAYVGVGGFCATPEASKSRARQDKNILSLLHSLVLSIVLSPSLNLCY